jgi:hypothetical protein
MQFSNNTPLVPVVIFFLLEAARRGPSVTTAFWVSTNPRWHPSYCFNSYRKNTPNCRFAFGSTTSNAENEVGKQNDIESYENNNGRANNNNNNNNHNSPQDEVSQWAELKTTKNNPKNQYELPWSDVQEFVLQDKLSKFVVRVAHHEQQQLQSLVLWRNLLLDTPELSGYPIPFVVLKLEQTLHNNKNQNDVMNSHHFVSPEHLDYRRVLPFLDEYEFEANGGLKGIASGVPGVADGTLIQTTPVENVSETVPRGYVIISSSSSSSDSAIIYELGQPKIIAENGRYYQQPQQQNQSRYANLQFLTNMANPKNNPDGPLLDPELINLGALTAVMIGGAIAAQTLSHHLTINVFWV